MSTISNNLNQSLMPVPAPEGVLFGAPAKPADVVEKPAGPTDVLKIEDAVREIFKFLSVSDMSRVSCVCKTWNRAFTFFTTRPDLLPAAFGEAEWKRLFSLNTDESGLFDRSYSFNRAVREIARDCHYLGVPSATPCLMPKTTLNKLLELAKTNGFKIEIDSLVITSFGDKPIKGPYWFIMTDRVLGNKGKTVKEGRYNSDDKKCDRDSREHYDAKVTYLKNKIGVEYGFARLHEVLIYALWHQMHFKTVLPFDVAKKPKGRTRIEMMQRVLKWNRKPQRSLTLFSGGLLTNSVFSKGPFTYCGENSNGKRLYLEVIANKSFKIAWGKIETGPLFAAVMRRRLLNGDSN